MWLILKAFQLKASYTSSVRSHILRPEEANFLMWLIPKACHSRARGRSLFFLYQLLSCLRALSLIRSVTRIVRPVADVALMKKKKSQ